MPSDYSFKAYRRRTALVIKGAVLAPPGSQPYLVRAFDARPKSRRFRLAFHHNTSEVPFELQPVEHIEEDVPAHVDVISIDLPNEKTFTINRRH